MPASARPVARVSVVTFLRVFRIPRVVSVQLYTHSLTVSPNSPGQTRDPIPQSQTKQIRARAQPQARQHGRLALATEVRCGVGCVSHAAVDEMSAAS